MKGKGGFQLEDLIYKIVTIKIDPIIPRKENT